MNGISEEIISVKIAYGILTYYKISPIDRITDYSLHSTELIADDNKKYVRVIFDVKPYFPIGGFNLWYAGSGEIGDDGWVNKKYQYYEYINIGDLYIITNGDGYTGL